MTGEHPNLDLVNINTYKTGDGLYTCFLDIEQKKSCLTSIKGHNYVPNVRKMMRYNPNIDPDCINASTEIW